MKTGNKRDPPLNCRFTENTSCENVLQNANSNQPEQTQNLLRMRNQDWLWIPESLAVQYCSRLSNTGALHQTVRQNDSNFKTQLENIKIGRNVKETGKSGFEKKSGNSR